MDTVRPTSGASRRTGSLLVLALAAAVVVPGLAPVTAAGAGAAPAPLVEVVVTSTSEGVAAVTDAVRAAGGTVLDALPLAGGVSAELPAGAVLAPSFTVVDNAPITLASSRSPARDGRPLRSGRPSASAHQPARAPGCSSPWWTPASRRCGTSRAG
jgi:hypothetical protein